MFQNDASVFLHVWCWWCLSETNRLTDISLAKIDSESAENCILGSATMSQMQLPTWQEENAFRERKKKSWEDCSKQRVLSFSLAESLPGKKRSPSSSCWLCSYHGKELPLLVSQLYLIEISVYYFFTFSPFDQDFSLKALLIKSQVV